MRVMVATEQHFVRTPDGAVHTAPGARDNRFWSRYLDAFSSVTVLGRVAHREAAPAGSSVASGPQISFADLPDSVGLGGLLRRLPGMVRMASAQLADRTAAIILRLPGNVGGVVWSILPTGRPYGVEVVGDPYDVFAPEAMQHPLRPVLRYLSSRAMRRQCAGAGAAAYVTEYTLQRRYPASKAEMVTHYSSIELPEPAFCAGPREARPLPQVARVVMVGTLAQLYKAPDVAIDAAGLCLGEGVNLELVLVGGGKHRAELEMRARAQGIEDQVHFTGHLPPGKAIEEQLDQAHLFVLPSRQEGLPRAMIEAMARGLPCIGSDAGGIPELLPPEDMVPVDDAAQLARKIREVLSDPERMARMSARNLAKARAYRADALRERRRAFYAHVRDMTEAWLKNASSS